MAWSVALAIVVGAACGRDEDISGPPPELPNQPPVVAGAILSLAITVGDTVRVDVSTAFIDPDGDVLSYETASSNVGVATVSASGSTVTIAAVAEGNATITLTARDPEGLSASQEADVTVHARPPPPNQAPVPVGSIDARTVTAGETVSVDVAGHFSDPDDDALTYSASTSDAGVATAAVAGSTVTVTGVAEGNATITVTAADPGGLTATQDIAVAVEAAPPPNRAPVPVGSIDARTVTAGETVSVDVAGHFSDPDDDALTYSASTSDAGVATAAVAGSTVTVTGVAEGNATITVTAADPGGLAATQDIAVAVEAASSSNRAPVADGVVVDKTSTVGGTLSVDVASKFSDPDNDALTYSASTSDAAVATASVSESTVTVTGVGEGETTITVTATDPGRLAAQLTFNVTVGPNRAPVATGTFASRNLPVGGRFSLDVAGKFRDPDGNKLIYSASTSDDAIATASVSGKTVRLTGVGAGEATITVTATDQGELSASQTLDVTVTETGGAPAVVGIVADKTLIVGGKTSVNVAGKFSNPGGGGLTYSASTSNGSVATPSVSGSTVTVTGVGEGEATIGVAATNQGGLRAELTFSVTVRLNRAPVAVGSVADKTVAAGGETSVNVASKFDDPDGHKLTYSASTSDDGVATASVAGNTVTVTGVADGSATITVTATDPGGLTAQLTFDVTVRENRAPQTIGIVASKTVVVEGATSVNVASKFSDPDGNRLTYSASSSNDAVATASASGSTVTVRGVAEGEATITVTAADPGGLTAQLTFDVTVRPDQGPEVVGIIADKTVAPGGETAVNVASKFSYPGGGRLTYSAATSDDAVATASVSGSTVTVTGVADGQATITVTATSQDGRSASLTFDVTVRPNRAPEVVGIVADKTLASGAETTVRVASKFSDPDGNRLVYSASTSAAGVATVSVSGQNVKVQGVAQGQATITVTATDTGGLTDSLTFDVTVTASGD